MQATEDSLAYTERQCKKLLSSINDGNKIHGGLTLVLEVSRSLKQALAARLKQQSLETSLVAQADALIGCFRFLEGYYLLFVTQKKLVGSICGKVEARMILFKSTMRSS